MNDKSESVLNAVSSLLSHYGYFLGKVWHVNDVHSICKAHGYEELTDLEAIEIFDLAASNAYFGEITKTGLEKAIIAYVRTKKNDLNEVSNATINK